MTARSPCPRVAPVAGALTLTNASAVLVNSGSLSNSGRVALSAGASFTQTAGALTGQPVAITAGTLSDTAGTGAFDLLGNSNLSGTIPAGQTVTVLGNASGTASTTLTGPVTNNGTLILDNTTGGDWASVTGATLTNNATIKSQVEGSSNNFLEAPVLNETTGNINILTGELRQDHATTTTNKGTITTNAAARYNLTSGQLVNAASGILAFDLTSASPSGIGTINLAGGTLTPGGTVAPTLLAGYAPPLHTEFDVITGNDPGGFPSVANDFVGDASQPGFFGVIRGQDSTTTAVSPSPDPSSYGAPITLTATISVGAGGLNGGVPTGSR